jgi:cold shock CspA family protein/ribosome-associated translation inhibitor RaiA
MQVPPEIAFRNVQATEPLKEAIAAGIDSLEEVYDRLISCRVMVEETNPARRTGKLNHVRIELSMPGREVVVNRNPPRHPDSQDLFMAVGEAFEIARRRLREHARIQRGEVKARELPPHGRIVKLVDDETPRYGFILSAEGRDIYFHENSLVRGSSFDDLEVGDEVRFHESAGDEGPQASTVEPRPRAPAAVEEEGELPLE